MELLKDVGVGQRRVHFTSQTDQEYIYKWQRQRLLLFSHQVMSDPAISWTAARQASLFRTNSWSLPKFMSIESEMSSNHLVLSSQLT